MLPAAGFSEKTLIVFASDHGMAFAGAKTTVYEPGLRVPRRRLWPRTVATYLNRPRFKLYHLGEDPQEETNLADDPAHTATLHRLRGPAGRLNITRQSTFISVRRSTVRLHHPVSEGQTPSHRPTVTLLSLAKMPLSVLSLIKGVE